MHEKINIGDYLIKKDVHGRVWIEWASGESMVVDELDLVKILDKFWEENF